MRGAWLAAAVALSVASGGTQELHLARTVAPGFRVAAVEHGDLDGDGASELVVVGRQGEVRVWRPRAEGGRAFAGRLRGSLVLEHAARTLLALADVGGQGLELVAAAPDGVRVWSLDRDGGFSGRGTLVAPRARFSLRVDAPRFARILQDLNGDGRPDLVVPKRSSCELWLNVGAAVGGPGVTFRKSADVAVRVDHDRQTRVEALSDRLRSAITIPNLRTEDVNGDGRKDLLVETGLRRAWHLQRPDGSFPARPDVTVDLGIFRDTTPGAGVQPGRTLAIDGAAQMQSRDLDADGLPDFVIAHRRKVWVFHGTKRGPQFTDPTAILKVPEDITVPLLVRLDDDPLPDLLVIKIQIPTVATLLLGLVGDWDIGIDAIGYVNRRGRTFEAKPRFRGHVAVRLPAIKSLLKDPDALIARFVDASKRFRRTVEADVDGNGVADVLLPSKDDRSLDLWLRKAAVRRARNDERDVRRILFEDEERVWGVDRILGFLGSLANERMSRLTDDKRPSVSYELRPARAFRLIRTQAADLDGNGAAEIVLTYRDERSDASRTVIDILELE